jgi:hypothetical protein
MFATIHPIIRIAGLLLAGFFCTGCFMAPEDQDMHPARITLEMGLEIADTVPAAGALNKASGTASRRMVVLMISNKGDEVRDTITGRGAQVAGEGTFLAGSTTTAQTVTARYELAPHRKWKIAVKVLDARDSLQYSDSSMVQNLKAFEYRTVAMKLKPRFTGYTARFALPASIRVAEQGSRQVYFTRLALSIDGKIACDSTVPVLAGSIGSAAFMAADPSSLPGSSGKRFFKPASISSSIALAHDYVKPGDHQFTLSAYGYLEGDTMGVTAPRLLFQGDRSTALGKVASEEVALDWKATDAGAAAADNGGLVVKLGTVHTMVINVVTSGAIDF